MEEPIRAVTYARVSTEDQARTGYSLQSQAELCRQHAKQQDWLVVAEISDDGISGATLDRPGLDRVRSMAEAGAFDVLVVYDLDRLSRRLVFQQIIELELGNNGVRVEYVNGGYANNDEGELQKNIRAVIAEYERAKIAERNARGRRTKARNGKVVGSGVITYGYDYADGEYTINESEAEVVRLIFQLYRDGTSLRGIARHLTDEGCITRTGKREWSFGTVTDMLRNETYCGTLYYGKRKPAHDGTHTYRDKSQWIPVDVPSLISRQEWELVQAQMDHNRDRVRRRPTHQYLLRGMLRCPVCKRAYSGAASGDHRYYRDGGRKHRSVRADRTEKIVWDAMRWLLTDQDHLVAGWKKSRGERSEEREITQAELDQAEKQRDKALVKLDKLTASFLDPDIAIAKDEYNRLRANIQRDIDRIDEKVEKLRRRLEAGAITEAQMHSMQQFVEQVRDNLDDADFDVKRQLLQALQVEGDIRRDEKGREEIVLNGLFPGAPLVLSYETSKSDRHL